MTVGRAVHTATLLGNGKVLIAGGTSCLGGNCPGNSVLATAELYDPITKTFSATGKMTTPRAYHVASALNNGKVLIAGGSICVGPVSPPGFW